MDNSFKQSKSYIKYSECRHLLRAAVEILGYKLVKEDSTARDLKYKSDAFDDVIIITASTRHELFFNPRSSERGDVVQFLQHRNGSSVNQYADLQSNREFVDRILREASNFTLGNDYVATSVKNVTNIPFSLSTDKYSIEPLPESPDQLPYGVVSMLKRRGMTPDVFWHQDIRNSVGILWVQARDKRVPNLVFLWKTPESDQVVGAQYKFYMQELVGSNMELVGKKIFVKGSDRTKSLWMTDMVGKTKLFVTEDVFDAIAHKLLTKDDSYGYCATGGSITPEQISCIRTLANKHKAQLVLGNDRDGAGMLSNLKIITDMQRYEYSKKDSLLTVTLADGTLYSFDYSLSTDEMVREIRKLATTHNILMEVPRTKDWNDDLKSKPSETLSTLQQDCKKNCSHTTAIQSLKL